jgi:serine/threonine protein kinase
MGNQLATAGSVAANIDAKDVNPKLTQVGPLGRKRGRLFTSMHCRYGEERRDVVVKILLRAYGDTEQASVVASQEVLFGAIETVLRTFRSPAAEAELRSPRPTHLLHYTATKVTERAIYLERPFVHHSLADRLHLRPFMDTQRRLFLVYQLFMSVHELHREFGMSHGDLKPENVLVSSGGWLYITDVAPYKPTTIEAFNPANFEFYFDNAETRVCCLAPDRFTGDPAEPSPSKPPPELAEEEKRTPPQLPAKERSQSPARIGSTRSLSPTRRNESSPTGRRPSPGPSPNVRATDARLHPIPETSEVFSAACVAAFILTDEPLFRLSNVLELRNRISYAEQRQYVLDALSAYPAIPGTAREFLADCLVGIAPTSRTPAPSPATLGDESFGAKSPDATAHSLNNNDGPLAAARPAPLESDVRPERLCAVAALERYSGSVFPAYFPMLYHNILPTMHALSPDVLIHVLWTRLYDIIDGAVRCEWDPAFAKGMARTAGEHREVVASRLATAARKTAASGSDVSTPASPATGPVYSSPPGGSVNASPNSSQDPDADGFVRLGAPRIRTIQAEVLDHIAPLLVNALRFSIAEDNLVKGLALIERVGAMCSEECRRDHLLPAIIHVVQSSKIAVTSVVRGAALRALATVCAFIRVLPASECFIYEEYILPAVTAAVKLQGNKSLLFDCTLAETLPSIMKSALFIVDQRQGLGASYRSRLDYDSQRDVIVHRGWTLFQPLLAHTNSSVLITALRQAPVIIPVLGSELVADTFLALLSTHLAHIVVEVRREMLRALTHVAAFLRHGMADSTASIVLLLDEAITKSRDARSIYSALDAVRLIVERKLLTNSKVLGLVQVSVGLLAHPSTWVSSAAARLLAAAAKNMDPVDVLVNIAAPVRALLRDNIPLAMLDRLDVLR